MHIIFRDMEEAISVIGAVQPDNTPLPAGMNIAMEVSGNVVKVLVECIDCSIMRLIATLDDVLEAIKLSLEVYRLDEQ